MALVVVLASSPCPGLGGRGEGEGVKGEPGVRYTWGEGCDVTLVLFLVSCLARGVEKEKTGGRWQRGRGEGVTGKESAEGKVKDAKGREWSED